MNDKNDQENELSFVFPYNYSNMSKLLGRWEWSGVCLGVAWLAIVVFILFLLHLNVWVNFYVFLLIGMPVAVFFVIGINGDSTLSFVKYVVKFTRTAKLYLYRKN